MMWPRPPFPPDEDLIILVWCCVIYTAEIFTAKLQ